MRQNSNTQNIHRQTGYIWCSTIIQINEGVMEISYLLRGWCVIDREPLLSFYFFLNVCFGQHEFKQETVLGQFPRNKSWDGDFWGRDLVRQWSQQNPVQKGDWGNRKRAGNRAKMWFCLESQPDVSGSHGMWRAPWLGQESRTSSPPLYQSVIDYRYNWWYSDKCLITDSQAEI